MSTELTHYEINRRAAERDHDKAGEFAAKANEAAINSAYLVLRTEIVINGGAAIAVLAFAGSLASRDKVTVPQLAAIATSLVWFAYGVLASAVAMGLTYLTNYANAGHIPSQELRWEHPYVKETGQTAFWKWVKHICHIAAVVTTIASLAAFLWGMWNVSTAIEHLAP